MFWRLEGQLAAITHDQKLDPQGFHLFDHRDDRIGMAHHMHFEGDAFDFSTRIGNGFAYPFLFRARIRIGAGVLGVIVAAILKGDDVGVANAGEMGCPSDQGSCARRVC